MYEAALSLYPGWILGALMICAVVVSGNRDLLRVQWKSVLNWALFMVPVTVWKMIGLHQLVATPEGLQILEAATRNPWQIALLVFWEDMVFAVPITILDRYIKNLWIKIPTVFIATLFMALIFGVGHWYEGGFSSACILAAYIPLSVYRGSKFGFGTMILCHMLFDLCTYFCVFWTAGGL